MKDYQHIIDKVKKKYSLRKAKNIFVEGRVTLPKVVLEAIPTYSTVSSMVPKGCIKEIHNSQRSFIWGDGEDNKNIHIVNWNIITMAKDVKGLGLRKLTEMNKTCMAKLS